MAKRILRLLVKQTPAPLAGELVIPNSKYHAHRALILASLTPGRSRIHGLSDAGHVGHTIQALRRLGTVIRLEGDTFVVDGGPYRPTAPEVSVGSSGTTLYFLTGLASLSASPVTIVGQKYFQRRPIRPLLGALEAMGVQLSSPTGCPPISVAPRRPTGGELTIPGTLSQWISGLLLLAPFATGPTVIRVDGDCNERSYIDLTIRMMAQFGLHVAASPDGREYRVEPDQQPQPATVTLPPDIGAAAFGLALTALHPSDVLFRGLRAMRAADTDHPEADLLDIISRMGLPMAADEATGQVRVRHQGIDLAPIHVDCRDVPDMLPILSVLATFAGGESRLDHVAHVRLKESDRVAAMLQLNRMGGNLRVVGDRLVIRGVPGLRGADLSSYNDHRVLMSLAIAGSRADGETRLTYPNAYRISYPRFLDEMTAVGASMAVSTTEDPSPTDSEEPAVPVTAEDVAMAGRITIGDHVRRWAARGPDEPAVVEVAPLGGEDVVTTWAELDRRADVAAMWLLGLGVAPGEAVALQLPNVTDFCVLTLAITRIGAVCCPLMPIFREREVGFMVRQSRARVLIVPHEYRGRHYAAEVEGLLEAAGDDRPALEHVAVVGGDGSERLPSGGGVVWHRFGPELQQVVVDPQRVAERAPGSQARAQLLFTSGTSGEPKGVVHRMDSLTRAAAMEVRHLGLSGQDRIFIPSPLAHQTGFLYGMWLAWVLGAPQILQATWDGPTALAALRRHHGTFVQAATPFLMDLVAAVETAGEQPEDLRIFVATGAAVPRHLAERATQTLGAAVCGAWGTTETCLGSLAAPTDEPANVWGTDGRALDGIRLRITDDTGRVLGPGEEGNFEVWTDCLFEEYLDRPEATAEAVTPDGWYRSGDLATIDANGYVRISGRVKDVINRGGEKIPVAEIEQLLHRHPAVADVAIVAMADERLGERACAFVVANQPFEFAEMQRYLDDQQVAKQYWPERLELIEQLPRNPAGKVQKFVLRERTKHFN